MGGFDNRNLNNQVALSVLEHIVQKVICCLELMLTDCKQKSITLENNENRIRDYLLENYLDNLSIRHKLDFSNFRFISEAPENYINSSYIGRVDLKIISKERFHFPKEYFIIECKRIDGSRKLNREYVVNGIARFVGKNHKYSSYYKSNCLLGFVIKKINIEQNTNSINQLLQDTELDLQVDQPLHLGSVPDLYYSSHHCNQEEKIVLLHVFSDCESIINK